MEVRVILIGMVLLIIFLVFDNVPAFAAPASIIGSGYTDFDEITIDFDLPIDWVIGDFTSIIHDFTGGTPTVISIMETSPSATVTIIFSGPEVFNDETGSIDIAAIADSGSGNTFAGSISEILLDEFPPEIFSDSIVLLSPTSFELIWEEDLNAATVTIVDFTVSNNTVTGVSESSPGIITVIVSSILSGLVLVSQTIFEDVCDNAVINNCTSDASLSLTLITEGSSESISVGVGGTGSFNYFETEDNITGPILLDVTLPVDQAGVITVVSLSEEDLEFGTNLVTTADITGPCTNACTIQFTVRDAILAATGVTPETASIFHDINENGLLEPNEEIQTTKDTTTIPGSTIFIASANFTSAFGVGGKSGSTGASDTGGSENKDRCDSSAFGRGTSIRVYEISYDMCDIQQLNVTAKSSCGPANLSILYDGGMTRGGLRTNQPYLDENKVLLTAPISQDYNKFRVLVENDKSYYDKLIIPQKLHGLITECKKIIIISHDTGYLSNQTSSFENFTAPLSNQTISSDDSTKSEPEKIITQKKVLSTDGLPPNDTFFEFENNAMETTPRYIPEPCVDTWDDSCWESKSSKDHVDKFYLLNWLFDLFQS